MNSSAWKMPPLVLIAVIGLITLALWYGRAQEEINATPITCADLSGSCTARVAGRDISLGIVGKPIALKPFQLWLKAAGARKVTARFTMQGMNMGINLYILHADSAGVFRASVILPMCVSGRREWTLTVDIDGTRIAVPFVAGP